MAGELKLNNVSAPSAPATGKVAMYANTDKYVHTLNEAGYDHIQLQAFFTSNQSGDFTMANSASAQSPFAAANDVVTLPASTTYIMEGLIQITGMGATTRTTALEFDAGSASLTSISYYARIATGAAQTLTTTTSDIHSIVATATVLNATQTTAAATIWFKGLVRINAAGTFIPQVKFSADPTGTIVCKKESWFMLTPLGTNTVASIGSWA